MAGRSSSNKGRQSAASKRASAVASVSSSARSSGAAAAPSPAVTTTGSLVLYPTVAVSDFVFAAVNFVTAYLLWRSNSVTAALGISIVGFAASAGVLRFGFLPQYFTGPNEQLAETAAFVGLPMVGLSHVAAIRTVAGGAITSEVIIIALVVLHTFVRGMIRNEAVRAKLRVPFNVLFFIGPMLAKAYALKDVQLAAALGGFIVAGVFIRADRDSSLFGCRRENLFHYVMAAATFLMGQRLIA